MPFLLAFLPRLAVRAAAEAVVVEAALLRVLPGPLLPHQAHLRLLVVHLPLRGEAVAVLQPVQRLPERPLLWISRVIGFRSLPKTGLSAWRPIHHPPALFGAVLVVEVVAGEEALYQPLPVNSAAFMRPVAACAFPLA